VSETVTTVGSGVAQAAPDAVAVVLVVEVDGATPAEALRGCGAAQDALLTALGVTASASGLSVQPSWDHERNRPGKPTATSRVSARLPDLSGAGELVTAALEAAGRAARLESLTPVVSDTTAALEEARALAFATAQVAAAHYASLAGRALDRVVSVSEGGYQGGPVRARKAMVMDAGGFNVAEGAQDVTASVTVTWAFAD
jgi:uncharacterized protein YggE